MDNILLVETDIQSATKRLLKQQRSITVSQSWKLAVWNKGAHRTVLSGGREEDSFPSLSWLAAGVLILAFSAVTTSTLCTCLSLLSVFPLSVRTPAC